MAFTGALFLFLFLPLVLVGWYALPPRGRTPFLLLASWVFFAWWRLDFLALLVGASVATWIIGAGLGMPGTPRRLLLLLGIVINVGCLAFFKYANFGIQTLNSLLVVAGVPRLSTASIALPVGISFFTFKAVSYLVDIYRGTARPARGFLELASYIAFFPQVTAGPIERFSPFSATLREPRRSWEGFSQGAVRFLFGFCKKVLVADTVGTIADAAFALHAPRLVDAWVGTAAYTVQLYWDFSGYSDMAIGLCGMLGMECMENFQTPYLSRSIGEFWRRWHISLSSWLRDYIYFPLGGNRRGEGRTYLNLALVMLIGGLWHGSSWTFVLWGGWHGLLLVVDRLRRGRTPLPRVPGTALTVLAVALGWVLFRAPTLAGAAGMYAGMAGLHGAGLSTELAWQLSLTAVVTLCAALVLTWMGPWIRRRLAAGGVAAQRVLAGGWIALVPLFALGLLKIMAESYAPVLYAKF